MYCMYGKNACDAITTNQLYKYILDSILYSIMHVRFNSHMPPYDLSADATILQHRQGQHQAQAQHQAQGHHQEQHQEQEQPE